MRRGTRASIALTVIVAAVVAVILVGIVIAPAPAATFWKRYVGWLAHEPGPHPISFFEPRERIEGVPGPQPPRVSPEYEGIDPAALRAAAEYASARRTLALIVSRHGHIVFEQYWHGSDFETLVDAGDFSAVIPAVMVGLAQADRKIALPAEPVGNYLREWQEGDHRAITLQDLLQMSSGLSPGGTGQAPWTAAVRDHLGSDLENAYLQREVEVPHGSRWVWQPADPQLLSLVVARATGMRYAEYVSRTLWKRLGAGDAWLWLDRESGMPHADCGMLTRQGDWVRVGEMLANDGVYAGDEIVAPAWVREMRRASSSNPGFGYQLYLAADRARTSGPGAEPYASADLFFLQDRGGHRLWMVPSLDLVILRTGTGPPPDWDDARIPNLIIRGTRDFRPGSAPTGKPSDLVPNH